MKQKDQHLKQRKKYTVAVCIGVFTDEWCKHMILSMFVLSIVVAKSYFSCVLTFRVACTGN